MLIINSFHCCPVKELEKEKSLYFSPFEGIKELSQTAIPKGNTSYDEVYHRFRKSVKTHKQI